MPHPLYAPARAALQQVILPPAENPLPPGGRSRHRPFKGLKGIGQSVWLDHFPEDTRKHGVLAQCIEAFLITGLSPGAASFDEVCVNGVSSNLRIRRHARESDSSETLFMDLTLDAWRSTADIFQPVFAASGGLDGWGSMDISPLLADDTAATIKTAFRTFRIADRPNLFVKIPGTSAGLVAMEELIFRGVPVNVTMLFSLEQYRAAATAHHRGMQRRMQAGLQPAVASIASIVINGWDRAVDQFLPASLRHSLGLAMSARIYASYRYMLRSPRWAKLASTGARPPRLLWTSTACDDVGTSDTYYVEGLVADHTIVSIPGKTLAAFSDHGHMNDAMALGAQQAEIILARVVGSGIDLDTLATSLQRNAVQKAVESWHRMMGRLTTLRTLASDASATTD
jgi:transaldolase